MDQFHNMKGKKQAREEWMHAHGFPTTGSLAKQVDSMLLCMMSGKVAQIETGILQAIDWSPVLHGESCVDLDPTMPSRFWGRFDMGGGELMTKRFDSIRGLYEWMMQMMVAQKNGSLRQNVRQAETMAKPALALDKATGQVSSNALSDVLNPGSGEMTKDVTPSFMAMSNPASAGMKESCICMHRGSLKTMTTLAYTNRDLCALLLGKNVWNGKFHSVQAIMTTEPVEGLLDHPKVLAKCKSAGLIPCGAVVVAANYNQEQCAFLRQSFQHLCEAPLFVVIDFSEAVAGERSCWEFDRDQKAWVAVELSWTTQPKNATERMMYNICWIDELGSSHIEEATALICKAIVRHVQEKTQATELSASSSAGVPGFPTVRLRKIQIAGDGMCGWRCVLAMQNLKQFEAVKRNQAAYPVNPAMNEQEIYLAKLLHKAVCETARAESPPALQAAIERVFVDEAFAPYDLEWIAPALGITIRCTCAREAGWLQNKYT